MAEEHAKSVYDMIRTTPHDSAGIRKVFDAADAGLTSIKQDISELLDQREDLVAILRQYAHLYEIFESEQLRAGNEIEIKTRLTYKSPEYDMNEARRSVLTFAGSGGPEITDEQVLQMLNDTNRKIPWRNPKAVIATILLRSGRWRKKGKGVFVKVEESGE